MEMSGVEVIYFYSAFSGVIVEIEAVSIDSLMPSSPAKRVCPTVFLTTCFWFDTMKHRTAICRGQDFQ
jgi:hypothetical protein